MRKLEALVSLLDVLSTDSRPFDNIKNLIHEERKGWDAGCEGKEEDVEPGNQVGKPPGTWCVSERERRVSE